MAAEERVSVKTSVPKYQKDAWKAHADTLEMSQSEFVRTMVQAGRREFEVDPPKPPSADANPRGSALRKPVLEALSDDEPRRFEGVVDAVAEQLEELVEDTIDSLDENGIVSVSPRGEIKRAGEPDGHD